MWWRNGPVVGTDSSVTGWNPVERMTVTFQEQQQAKLPWEGKIKLKAGELCSFYFHTDDSNRGGLTSCGTHDAGGISQVTSSDDYIDVLAGSSHSTLWGGERTYATGFLGTVHYLAF